MAAKGTIIDFLLNQQRDASTHLANGTVSFYAAGTNSFKPVWTDNLKTSEAANPYTLDSRGAAVLYGDGNYKIVLKNVNNVVIATWDNVFIGDDISGIDLSSLVSQVSLTNRDFIGNSNFNIWNYGTTINRTTLTDTQTADGWYYSSDGTGAGTLAATRQDFTFGQTEVPENPLYYMRLNKTSATTGCSYEYFAFRLPIRTAASQQMTFRCYAKAATPKDITFVVKQYFGTGGSTTVTTTTPAMTLTTSWAKYNKTFTVPSVSGKTIGSGSFVEIGISLPTNVTFDISIASVKFETGAVASAGEYRTAYEDELRTAGKIGIATSFLYADLAGGTNEKYWRADMNTATKKFTISALDDSQSNPVTAIEFVRNGTSITSASIPNVPTPSGADNSTKLATTAFVQQVALNTSLPGQAGNSGKFLTTNGSDASWGDVIMRQWKNQTFNSNGTFTVPTGVETVFISGTGGGGGGSLDVGGASGAACEMNPVVVTAGQVITVTIGTGGAGISISGTASAGTASSFGSDVVLPGGSGGTTGGVAYGGLKTRQHYDIAMSGTMSNTDATTIGSFITGASTWESGGNGSSGSSRFPSGGPRQGAGGYFGAGGNGADAPANSGAGGGKTKNGGSGKIIVWWLGV